MDPGMQAALDHIDSLPEPRQTRMRQLHALLLEAMPDADVSLWMYSGTLIGYGSYEYSNSKGPAGRWFSMGLANRKSYISLYSMGTRGGRYLIESVHDRFPGTTSGRSCLNIRDHDAFDDDAVRDLARETWAQFRDGFSRP